MYVKPYLLAAGLLAVAGCAGNVTIPSLGLDHPANPRAAAAPLSPPPIVPEAKKVMADMRGMRGMNHGSMKEMQEMDHGSMKGMDQDSMQGMEGEQHAY